MKGKAEFKPTKSAEKRPEEQAEGGHHRRHPLEKIKSFFLLLNEVLKSIW